MIHGGTFNLPERRNHPLRVNAMASETGGQYIRRLRMQSMRSQAELEFAAGLGDNYLKRIELGQVARPQRDTLERILDALQPSYAERRNVLELYGYAVQHPLPTQTEIAQAQTIFRQSVADSPIPVQLLDCALRLIDWNGLLARLAGRTPDDPAMRALAGRMITHVLYDPQFGIRQRLQNFAEWSGHMLPVLIHELQPYLQEAWAHDVLEELRRSAPGLDTLLNRSEELRPIPARPLRTIIFTGPNGAALPFRIASESFTNDTRFRVIYYFPADDVALAQCRAWHTNSENDPDKPTRTTP
jgi:transcriptional regulator with XRE-family HTH domain